MFNRAPLDLFKLFRLVMKAGGYQAVLMGKQWVSTWAGGGEGVAGGVRNRRLSLAGQQARDRLAPSKRCSSLPPLRLTCLPPFPGRPVWGGPSTHPPL